MAVQYDRRWIFRACCLDSSLHTPPRAWRIVEVAYGGVTPGKSQHTFSRDAFDSAEYVGEKTNRIRNGVCQTQPIKNISGSDRVCSQKSLSPHRPRRRAGLTGKSPTTHQINKCVAYRDAVCAEAMSKRVTTLLMFLAESTRIMPYCLRFLRLVAGTWTTAGMVLSFFRI